MDVGAHDAPAPQSQVDGHRSYWSLSEYAALMYWHIALEILAWVVIAPVAIMLSIARSRYVLPSQFAFLVVNALALLIGVVYSHKTPELYENNAHNKTGWIITWIASAWVFMALIQAYMDRAHAHTFDDETAQPLNAANMAQYQRVKEEDLESPYRYSHDSGQGTERNSASLYGNSRSPSVESENQQFPGPTRRSTHDDLDDLEDANFEKSVPTSRFDAFFSRNVARFVVGRTAKAIRLLYVVFERTIIIQGLVAILTGTVVYGGIAQGSAVFNVLAHYIKGGIFFVYGFLTLGRWMGAFADLGWAWNMKPTKDVVGRRKASLPSAEFTESFVIWLYGCTNVFLEHLAAWGDAWTAQDLEHVSISVLFFGGGLLGMIIESSKMRELLNSAVVSSSQPPNDSWQQPRQYNFSMNPMPALIILLLGKMMSSHHQASMLSTMIHSQWGSMFMGFALARCLTYIVMYIAPPTSYLPSRPPTEIITSFCLVAGGMTFMVSNKDTVAALESYGLDAMFTFTVTMGLTALLLAWTTVVIAIKGWALRVEGRSNYAKGRAGVLA
ncbi:integral membrane protein [Stagonosporopsis vannaccii]|nr:integral membrane protein [Stagonosporopsis vannaccii]